MTLAAISQSLEVGGGTPVASAQVAERLHRRPRHRFAVKDIERPTAKNRPRASKQASKIFFGPPLERTFWLAKSGFLDVGFSHCVISFISLK